MRHVITNLLDERLEERGRHRAVRAAAGRPALVGIDMDVTF